MNMFVRDIISWYYFYLYECMYASFFCSHEAVRWTDCKITVVGTLSRSSLLLQLNCHFLLFILASLDPLISFCKPTSKYMLCLCVVSCVKKDSAHFNIQPIKNINTPINVISRFTGIFSKCTIH